jgi:predicted permease
VPELAIIFASVLQIFLLLGVGAVARGVNWLTEEADHSLSKLLLHVLTPCLIFDKVVGNEALSDPRNLVVAPLWGFGITLACMFIARAFAPLAGLRSAVSRGTFGFVTGFNNYGYFPIPLVAALFDARTMAVLLIVNTGVELALWTAGVLFLTGRGQPGSWKRILNAPLFAMLIALAVSIAGAESAVPGFLRRAIHMLGECCIPVGLLFVGAVYKEELSLDVLRGGGRPVAVGLVLRLGLLPLFMLGLARLVPTSVELRQVAVVHAAMPCAVFPVVLARHYGGDVPTALQVIAATTVVSLATMPLWLKWGLAFVGVAP